MRESKNGRQRVPKTEFLDPPVSAVGLIRADVRHEQTAWRGRRYRIV
jgi:hypothetical protein